MEKTSIIFIGAGTASLTAANILLKRGFTDFIILEKGLPLKKRHCPGEANYTCKFCSAGCYTLEGVGGANANHGNKMCYFPASNSISKNFDYSSQSFHDLNEILEPYVDTKNNENYQHFSTTKKYNSDVLSKKHFREMVNYLADPLLEANKIIFGCCVTDIVKSKEKFTLTADNGNIYYAMSVVLGSGRSSYKTVKKIFENLDIEYVNQFQDIGVRIESEKHNFSDKYYYQVDPKFKFDFGSLGSARTFCAHNQGKVVPVQFGDSFYADGAFDDEFTQYNNIALMVRAKKILSNDSLEKWCRRINLEANHNLLISEISFTNASREQVVSQILDNIPLLSTHQHDKLLKKLLEKLIVEDDKLFSEDFYHNGTLKIYGPAIDLYWPKPTIDKNLESSVKNFYIIGDAAGLSRGFFQAIYSGAEWALNISQKRNHENLIDDKIWGSRISTSL